MNADVPDTVACPCGNGYAERRPEAIRERVGRGGNGDRYLRLTHVYRHQGCPIGGHIVVEAGQVTRRAGPLFTGGLSGWTVNQGGVTRIEADGGQP